MKISTDPVDNPNGSISTNQSIKSLYCCDKSSSWIDTFQYDKTSKFQIDFSHRELHRFWVVDDFNITVHDIRYMDKPVLGPVMHMIDEGQPRFIETHQVLLHTYQEVDTGLDALKDINDEYETLIQQFDDLSKEPMKGNNSDTNKELICVYSNTHPWSIVGLENDQSKNIVLLQNDLLNTSNFAFQLQTSSFYSKIRRISGWLVLKSSNSAFSYVLTSDTTNTDQSSHIYMQIISESNTQTKLQLDSEVKFVEDVVGPFEEPWVLGKPRPYFYRNPKSRVCEIDQHKTKESAKRQ